MTIFETLTAEQQEAVEELLTIRAAFVINGSLDSKRYVRASDHVVRTGALARYAEAEDGGG